MRAICCLIVFVTICSYSVTAQTSSYAIQQQAATDTAVFTIVEKMPVYPGGNDALAEYLKNNITYPKKARRGNITGTVFIQFQVAADGRVQNAKVLRGVSEDIDAEALRVVNSMPAWEPGMQKGKPVIVMYNLPIKFTLVQH
jgi:protein TonB